MEWKIAIANKSSFAERLMFLYYTLHKTFLPDTVYLTQMSSKHHHFIIKQYIRLFSLHSWVQTSGNWWLGVESVYMQHEIGCVMSEVWILFSPQLWSSFTEARICCCCYDEDNTSVTAWTQAWTRRNLHWRLRIVYAASRGDSGTVWQSNNVVNMIMMITICF